MADIERADQQHPNLHLTPEERRVFGQLFAQADADKIGVVPGERAVTFFEKTRLSSDVLGEIWQLADRENRGLLTPAGFGIVLRLIGYAQAGVPVSQEIALKPGGPLPRFEGITTAQAPALPAAPLQQQNSGAIRVPPLTADRVAQYTSLFEESGAQNGVLPGETAKSIFERAQLPTETMGRIWALADTEQKGALGLTEFIIAMHLLASTKNGSMRALPQILPAGLYEAAARRGAPSQAPRSRPMSDNVPSAIPRQFSGAGFQSPQRAGFQQPISTGDQWAISPQDKAQFDSIFASVDTQNRGVLTGEQAVTFFSNSRLPEEALAQIWDLADINSEGHLNRDEFAVAMYLIREQRSKTSGRDVLPQQLPPNLIPPSMRRQPIAPQQPTAPTFDNAANITAPKSASEDLFGLDAISSPQAAPLHAKSTGDSSAYATPPRDQVSSAPIADQGSHFKPFMPASSFGQSIMTPQSTGTAGSASPATARSVPQAQQRSAPDDLLGDPDPEVSQRLTAETTDLANLSNQVSTLTSQTQEIRNKRSTTEQDLGRAQNQKQQFQTRLAGLRTAYEQEARDVRSLEERLTASKNETKKLQSDMAMISGTHEDLRNQHRQISEALNADQNENMNLKERIRQASAEIEQMKPQLEKLRSDARHQKGLVAINKKQLATHEAEREKTRGDMEGLSEEHAQATKDLEQSQRDLESTAQSRAPPAAVTSPVAVASPAPSSSSMNPFFRRPSNPPPVQQGSVTSPFAPPNVASPNHNAFDSFFGPSAGTPTSPPPTSFRSDSPSVARGIVQGSSHPSADGAGSATPPSSPPQSISTNSPATASEPPAPPQSRQITSSFLPLRPNLEHSSSENSSVKVVPPASRRGEGEDTPSRIASEATIPESPMQHFQDMAAKAPQPPASELTPVSTGQEASVPEGMAKSMGPQSAAHEVPGAFPGDETPIERSQPDMFPSSTTPYGGSGLDPRVDGGEPRSQQPHLQPGTLEPFGKSSTPTSAKDEFENAFEGFVGDKGKAAEHRNGAVSDDPFAPAAPGQASGEFPPIRELDDDSSESESEKGFDDDFTSRSANKTIEPDPNEALQGRAPAVGQSSLAPSRPPFNSADSNRSDLPTPGAQASPPTYDQTVGPKAPLTAGDRISSNPFPAEFSGLLPSRDDPTSPPALSTQSTKHPGESNIASSAGIDRGLNFFPDTTPYQQSQPPDAPTEEDALSNQRSPMAPGASMAARYAYTATQPSSPPPAAGQPPQIQSEPPTVPAKVPPTPQQPKDDFDDFEDLAPAQEEDEKDDTLDFGRSVTDTDFNPIFDSPQTSRHHPGQSESSGTFPAPQPASAANDFGSFAGDPTAAAGGTRDANQSLAGGGSGAKEPVTHDWDAIFAGLDTPSNSNNTSSRPQNPASAFDVLNGTDRGTSSSTGTGLGKGQQINGNTTLPPQKGGAQASIQQEGADDDPILKRLIGMGFPRVESLKALERYDYNIDKAAEYLLSKSGS